MTELKELIEANMKNVEAAKEIAACNITDALLNFITYGASRHGEVYTRQSEEIVDALRSIL